MHCSSQMKINLEALQELFSTDTCTTVDAQFELTDFLVDFLHEVNHKVD